MDLDVLKVLLGDVVEHLPVVSGHAALAGKRDECNFFITRRSFSTPEMARPLLDVAGPLLDGAGLRGRLPEERADDLPVAGDQRGEEPQLPVQQLQASQGLLRTAQDVGELLCHLVQGEAPELVTCRGFVQSVSLLTLHLC